MKKITKFLAIVIFTPILLLTGCFFPTYDENGDNGGPDFMSGYKVCYKSQNYELDNTFEIYAKYILKELYVNFGIVSDTQKSIMNDTPLASNPKNYDRIRIQVGDDDEIINSGWKWTFSRNLIGAESQTALTDTETYYSSTERQTLYYNEFIKTYSTALEIVCIQISIGETPYSYTIQTNETTGTTNVFAGTINVNDENSTLLRDAKELFAQKAKYVGLTTNNIETLKNYLLENVIGTSITNTYNKIYYQNGTKTYDEVLTAILSQSPAELTKSILSPYPTALVKDINDSSFYVGKNNTLSHILSAEYQSFVLMPNEELNVGAFFLSFESDYEISITVKTDFIQNGTRTNLETQTLNLTPKNSFKNDTFATFMPEGEFDKFNNDGSLQAQTEKIINNQNGNNIYYILNENNIGILDSTKINNSYVEIVFEIDKTQNRDYYPFKVGVQGFM